jgi:hypothetical protein
VQRALLSTRPEWQAAVARLDDLTRTLERIQTGLHRARVLLTAPDTLPTIPGGDMPAPEVLQPEGEADALWKARLQVVLVSTRLVRQTAVLDEIGDMLAELAAQAGVSKKQ